MPALEELYTEGKEKNIKAVLGGGMQEAVGDFYTPILIYT